MRVVEAMLLPQTNGSTHTDIEPEHVGKLMFKMKDTPGDLRFWWHSHVNMNVFWSGTDTATIEKLGAEGWFLSTVFNKRKEMRSAYYSAKGASTPWGDQSLFLDELTTIIPDFVSDKAADWDAQYAENVKIGFTSVSRSPYLGYNGTGWPNSVVDYQDTDYDTPGYWHRRTRDVTSGIPSEGRRPVETSRPPAFKPPGTVVTGGSIVHADDVDDYGFTLEEEDALFAMGYDSPELDEFLDAQITRKEILDMAKAGVMADNALDLLSRGWTVDGVIRLGGDEPSNEMIASQKVPL